MKKKKLNYKNIILFIMMIIFIILFLTDWAIVLFRGATFTWLGITTNILYLCAVGSILEYLEEYAKLKEKRRK